ncbi:BrnT family toxin [Paraburkholderia sp. J94]|uniref:BrnT family toxin n=1 Tax=Paraburkholderia sp. J94 TaxID=2805441 RepID=UPI002AB19778|nr:BrnT family toxin [Paraburkholderia sp. J94]
MTQTCIVWDEAKRLKNLADHGVDFVDVDDTFFMDDRAITLEDKDHHEQRFVSVAMNGFGSILFVCYAYEPNGDIGLIHAREADAKQKKQYSKGKL